ncbi:MAG: redoxin domain-containing protein [Myxococcota bacterium]|nr:redoxin domain-containing protein [Myxococcota bacterium]
MFLRMNNINGPIYYLAISLALTVVPQFAFAQSNQSTLDQLMQRQQIQALPSPIAAPDFELKTLGNSNLKLSDTRGRWVLLTFFATWCGPCRSEMPALNKFHQDYHAHGFDVLGISSENNPAALNKFAKQYALQFPVLVDPTGKISSTYQASSIPISFLITPQGTLFGVARGARNWDKMQNLVTLLLETYPPNDEVAPLPKIAVRPEVKLPEILNPPTAERQTNQNILTIGDELEVNILLTWAGAFDEYLPHPPTLNPPAGLNLIRQQAISSSALGNKQVRYQYVYEATQEGTYELGPVEIHYTPRFDQQMVSARIDAPQIEIRPRPFVKWVIISTTTILLCVLIFFIAKKIQQKAEKSPAPLATPDLNTLFLKAKESRARGSYEEYGRCLEKIYREIGSNPAGVTPEGVRDFVAHLRFSGESPTMDRFNHFERPIQRVLKTRSLETPDNNETLEGDQS